MTQTFTARFVHRLNDDGTIDSICSDCFVTVAPAAVSESVIEREERKHNCDTLPLARYKNCMYSEIYT
jgi:hypothetical protein